MKTILSFFVMMNLLAGSVRSQSTLAVQSSLSVPVSNPLVDPRVLRVFSMMFPSVTNATWNEEAGRYRVSFRIQQIGVIAIYTEETVLIKMRRSYSAEFMAPSLLIAIQKKYPGRSISGITEVTNGDEFIYEVTLKDDTHWYKLVIDASGRMETVEKFSRAELM